MKSFSELSISHNFLSVMLLCLAIGLFTPIQAEACRLNLRIDNDGDPLDGGDSSGGGGGEYIIPPDEQPDNLGFPGTYDPKYLPQLPLFFDGSLFLFELFPIYYDQQIPTGAVSALLPFALRKANN